jgi:hypothetical protein
MARNHAITRARALLSGCSAAAIAASACSVEELAGVMAAAAGNTGQLTIWTSDDTPSPIEVTIDGAAVGTLTAYRTSAPACGAATGAGAITITRPAGVYVLSARETRAPGQWPARPVTIPAGGCTSFALDP